MGGLVNRSSSFVEPPVDRSVEILKALANPQRLLIAWLLSEDDQTVSVLARRLGIRQCMASQQLGILRRSRLVRARRVGCGVSYTLTESKARALIQCLAESCNSAILDG